MKTDTAFFKDVASAVFLPPSLKSIYYDSLWEEELKWIARISWIMPPSICWDMAQKTKTSLNVFLLRIVLNMCKNFLTKFVSMPVVFWTCWWFPEYQGSGSGAYSIALTESLFKGVDAQTDFLSCVLSPFTSFYSHLLTFYWTCNHVSVSALTLLKDHDFKTVLLRRVWSSV